MFEILLGLRKDVGVYDNSDLPFPAGTPYKGVVRSVNSITATKLADDIGFTQGVQLPRADEFGWLHFVETDGIECLVAKKPLRYNISWAEIDAATNGGKKEITLFGEPWVVMTMTGFKTNPTPVSNANTGGQWNRYVCGVYSGPARSNANWPTDAEAWGPYDASMLGLDDRASNGTAVGLPNGSVDYTKELITDGSQSMRGYTATVGYPYMLGANYGTTGQRAVTSGWRPMLVKKSTLPPEPTTPYKGLVAADDFITGNALSTAMGYSQGTLAVDNVNWVHLEENGKTYYLAQKCIRTNVTYAAMQTAAIVDGSKTITIGGQVFKVRLMTGANDSSSEWNHWMYNLYGGAHASLPPVATRWASFTAAELNVSAGALDNGCLTYYQGGGSRGYSDITGYNPGNASPNPAYGWRPVLELVP